MSDNEVSQSKPGVLLKWDDFKERMKDHPQYASFDAEERHYADLMWQRLINARNQYYQAHPELDDMSIPMYVQRNLMRANTYIPPRRNRSDVTVTSGLAREKLLGVASHIHRLNFKWETHAFDKNRDEDSKLGLTFTNSLSKSRELENDDEKRLLRIMTLMTEGSCFVEEAWMPSVKTYKKIVDRSKLDPAKGFAGLTWMEKTSTTYQAESAVISMKNVLLGDLRQIDIEKQPFIATVEYRDFSELVPVFQNWENWKHVKPGVQNLSQLNLNNVSKYSDMTLFGSEADKCEVIKYQDSINDEYQIIINGTFMLPMGFPRPWEWDGMSVTGQPFELISPYFALGKSLMAKIDRDDELITMMLRVFMRKTLQSTNPPLGNLTGRKLPNNILDAGTIWNGVNPQRIGKLIEHAGVNGNEWSMFQQVRDFIDSKSISRIAQGQQLSRAATATEILELQRQAQIAIGLALFSYANLEKKMAQKRLGNIVSNWSKAEEETWDQTEKIFVKRFKTVEIGKANFGDKQGVEKVMFTDKEFTFKEKEQMGKKMFHDEEFGNSHGRTTIISVPMLKRLQFTYHITVTPSEEESDNLNKILFNEEYSQAANFFGPQSLNQDFYKRKFAKVWGNNAMDMFTNLGVDTLQRLSMVGAGGTEQMPSSQGGPRSASGLGLASAKPSALQAAGGEQLSRQFGQNEQKAQGAVMNR